MKRFLCTVLDVDGLPRAWGAAPSEETARAIAEQQWQIRLAERAAEGTTDRSEERGETIVEITEDGL